MHFVAILYEKTARSYETAPSTITLRGYNTKTWIPAELAQIRLPVYALAYAPCPTCRDIYLDRVTNIEIPFTWERYKGKVIDFIYKDIHKTCSDYVTQCRAQTFNLHDELISKQDELIEGAKGEFQRDYQRIASPPRQQEIVGFYESLMKIIRFEAELTSATINFEIARNRSASPRRIFSRLFDFNTDYSLNPQHQGFNSPATPDFIFRHVIIGDIKSGSWKRFFEYTVIAYALAYEDDTNQNMDYGVILNVELPSSRLVPVHYEGGIEFLDDRKRERFIALRNRKLEIINSRTDPGKPGRGQCPSDCPFLSHCWETGD
jgi:CRISPR-associated protein Csa1